MLTIIGLSDLEYDLITTYFNTIGLEVDEKSNTIRTKTKFTLEYFDDHIYINFPEQNLDFNIMRCDYWRIEIE